MTKFILGELGKLATEIERLQAEKERLEKALRRIADTRHNADIPPDALVSWSDVIKAEPGAWFYAWCWREAEAALKGQT